VIWDTDTSRRLSARSRSQLRHLQLAVLLVVRAALKAGQLEVVIPQAGRPRTHVPKKAGPAQIIRTLHHSIRPALNILSFLARIAALTRGVSVLADELYSTRPALMPVHTGRLVQLDANLAPAVEVTAVCPVAELTLGQVILTSGANHFGAPQAEQLPRSSLSERLLQ